MWRLKESIRKIIGSISPKLLVDILFYIAYGKRVDWKNPVNLNEKIQWLKFYSDTSLWSELADKYRVRNFVIEAGYSEILVELYNVWEDIDKITWDELPETFVMKVNNGCGDVKICKDKKSLNIVEWKKHFQKALKLKAGNLHGEPHYNKIHPLVLAEELLDSQYQSIPSDSLIDYKFWCFNGKPYCILCCSNRSKYSLDLSLYDMNWNNINDKLLASTHYKIADYIIPKPKSFEKMKEISCKLSKGFPHVRVDLYEVYDKPYFGELTFTSAGGFISYFTPDFLDELGNQIELSKHGQF